MSSSEAKTLPATEKKLRDARKKGQAPMQRDMGTAVGLAVGCGFLVVAGPRLAGLADGALEAALLGMDDPAARTAELVPALGRALAGVLGLLMGFLVVAAVLTAFAVQRGPIFSLEPISPKISNLDPVKGLGRIFGARGLSELAKNLLRLVVAAAATALVLREGIPALLHAPRCGLGCLLGALGAILAALFAAYVLIGILFAVPDIRLQQWLFARDMKMTKTEMKREQKESHGTPEIRQEQRRLRHEIASTETRLGARNATLVIFDEDVAVGLRYVKAEVGVPMVVARAQGAEAAGRLLGTAQANVVPLWRDRDLARAILDGARLAQPVPQEAFQDVAEAMAATAR